MKTLRLLSLALLICAALVTAQVRDPLPVPDIPGYKTLKCDFHMHTVFSDGDIWPTLRISEAWRDGLDAIALTDHADYRPHEADLKADATRPHALALPLAERLGLILIPGLEIGEGDIHCNLLFVTDPTALRGLKLHEALQKARAQDAFAFWNHPGWKQKPEWFPLIAAAYDEKLIQGMELVNGNTFYADAYPWIEEKKLAILSNSDVHRLATTRNRPITLVFAPTADAAGLREALFARRTAAWMGGEVWGAQPQLQALWQGAVRVQNSQLTSRPSQRGLVVRLRNTSAIPFRIQVRQSPPWVRASGGELRAESILGIPLNIAKDAPAGLNRVSLELEITNVHTGPDRNLVVRLPLRIEVAP